MKTMKMTINWWWRCDANDAPDDSTDRDDGDLAKLSCLNCLWCRDQWCWKIVIVTSDSIPPTILSNVLRRRIPRRDAGWKVETCQFGSIEVRLGPFLEMIYTRDVFSWFLFLNISFGFFWPLFYVRFFLSNIFQILLGYQIARQGTTW